MSRLQVDSTAASYKCRELTQTPSTTCPAVDSSTKISGDFPSEEELYLRLVSAEGEEFRVKREHALISGTIRGILSGPGPGVEETDVIYLYDMSSRVVEKVCSFFEYRARCQESFDQPVFIIEPDIALEMVLASTYLDC